MIKHNPNNPVIPDSPAIGDINSTKKGSGARYNADKVQWGLLPMEALEGCIRVFEFGAKKYSIGNWEKGMSWRAVYESLQRHLAAWQKGEELDDDSGLPHIDHAMCNLIMLTQYRKTYTEGDDRVSTLLNRKVTPSMTGDDIGIQTKEAETQEEQGNALEGVASRLSEGFIQGKLFKGKD